MIGLVFPGQGSQHIGMGEFLFKEFSFVRELFELASDTIQMDFKKLLFNSSETDLSLTENTQPALLLISIVYYKILKKEVGFEAAAACGHSVGEYAALVSSGVITFEDALLAVRKRGQYMQSAVPVGDGGMMALLGLSSLQVETLCRWAAKKSGLGIIEPANFNAPGQIVISGHKKVIEWIIKNYSSEIFLDLPENEQNVRRSKFIELKVSAPFHSSLMLPAEEKLADVLPFSLR